MKGWSRPTSAGRGNVPEAPLLQLKGVDTFYGAIPILQGIDIEIAPANRLPAGGNTRQVYHAQDHPGPGRPARGGSPFAASASTTCHRAIVARGVSLCENRRIFPEMTVLENLEMAPTCATAEHWPGPGASTAFPRLKSGCARPAAPSPAAAADAVWGAPDGRPSLILMDSPSMGLAPVLVERSFELIQQINAQGTTIAWWSRTQHGLSKLAAATSCRRGASPSAAAPPACSATT